MFFLLLDHFSAFLSEKNHIYGPIAPLLLLVDHIGPIRDNIKSTVSAMEVEKVKNT